MSDVFVNVFGGYDARWTPPKTLPELKAWVDGLVAQVPPEFVGNCAVEFGADDGHGENEWPHPTCHVYYTRPETAEERDIRIAKDRAEREATTKQIEASERRTLATLKAKYEGPASKRPAPDGRLA